MTATAQVMIGEATSGDANDVIRLFGALHRYNAALDPRFELVDNWADLVAVYLEQSHHSDESAWLLAHVGTQVVGFVLVEVHTDSPLYKHRRWAEIVGLYVDEEHRGGDVADRLMEHAYAWAQEHQLHTMQLYVTATNERAHRFYARHGFEPSQQILRRTLLPMPDAEQAVPPVRDRLHFGEGGTRPF
jgi:ribosomal protein S18 acetylase RimI-like enzyme